MLWLQRCCRLVTRKCCCAPFVLLLPEQAQAVRCVCQCHVQTRFAVRSSGSVRNLLGSDAAVLLSVGCHVVARLHLLPPCLTSSTVANGHAMHLYQCVLQLQMCAVDAAGMCENTIQLLAYARAAQHVWRNQVQYAGSGCKGLSNRHVRNVQHGRLMPTGETAAWLLAVCCCHVVAACCCCNA
jgi:hypothetical protein